jgi:hypothetical protein
MGLRERKKQENGEKYVTRTFISCTIETNVITVIKAKCMKKIIYIASNKGGKYTVFFKILVGKPEGKRSLKSVDWIQLAQDRALWDLGNESSGSIKSDELRDQINDYRSLWKDSVSSYFFKIILRHFPFVLR